MKESLEQLKPTKLEKTGNNNGVKLDESSGEILTEDVSGIRDIILEKLKGGYVEEVVEMKSKLELTDDVIQDPEVLASVRAGIIHYIITYHRPEISKVQKLKECFGLEEGFFQSAIREGISKLIFKPTYSGGSVTGQLPENLIENITEMKEKFGIPDDILQTIEKDRVITCIRNGDGKRAMMIMEKFALPKEIILDPEIQMALKEGVIGCLKGNRNPDDGLKLLEAFVSPEKIREVIESQEVQAVAKKYLIDKLSFERVRGADYYYSHSGNKDIDEYINGLSEFKRKFFLPIRDPDIQEALKEMVVGLLKKGMSFGREIGVVAKIVDKFPLIESVVEDVECQEVAHQTILKCLKAKNLVAVNKVKNFLSPRDSFLETQEVKDAYVMCIQSMLSEVRDFDKEVNLILNTKSQFPDSNHLIQQAIRNSVGSIDCWQLYKLNGAFPLEEDIINHPEVQRKIIEKLEKDSSNCNYELTWTPNLVHKPCINS